MAGERVPEPAMAISQLRAELRGLNPRLDLPPPASGADTLDRLDGTESNRPTRSLYSGIIKNHLFS